MHRLSEKRIDCEFPAHWPLPVKFDDHPYYREALRIFDQTRAVDFMAMGDPKLYMIEVKDYRSHAIENKDKLKSGDLLNSICRKTKDSLAVLYLAYRSGTVPADLEWACTHLFGPVRRPVDLIVLLEQDAERDHPTRFRRDHIRLQEFQTKLAARLRPYGLHAKVVNCAGTRSLPWSATAT